MDEKSLIESAQKGDLDAFNRLIIAYQDLAFSVASRLLGDDDLAADAVQNAFLSAYRSLRSYRGGSFKAWVMRMITNGCYDELRRQKRRPTTPLEPGGSLNQETNDSPPWMTSSDPSPESTLEQAELEHALQHCLDHLPIDFRTVVILVDIQGMDYEEVAISIHSPLGTVKSRLARARLKLRECLLDFQELLPAQFRHKGEVHE
ncbi:MAG: sigma-70 family RNA polymerase sigma factor [Chloroflexi bacterium]|nr:sigma-70 family RNA polymerase sigma factor [Chloroflexota bacterium]